MPGLKRKVVIFDQCNSFTLENKINEFFKEKNDKIISCDIKFATHDSENNKYCSAMIMWTEFSE